MTMTHGSKILMMIVFTLTFIAGTLAQTSPDQPASQDGQVIENHNLNSLEPPFLERVARSWSYEYQLLEQPAFLVASSGANAQVVENPQRWLQQHSVTLQLSEFFPKATSFTKLVQNAYDDLSEEVRAKPVRLGNDICRPGLTALECIAAGGNFWERLLSQASIKFSVSQRDQIQQGIILTNLTPSQGWAWGGEVNFKPDTLFVAASNWIDAKTALKDRKIIVNGSAKDDECLQGARTLIQKPSMALRAASETRLQSDWRSRPFLLPSATCRHAIADGRLTYQLVQMKT
jgi:hypothetical protein